MKLFHTNNVDIIQNCRQYFAVQLPSNLWAKRVDRFEEKLLRVTIVFCSITVYVRYFVLLCFLSVLSVYVLLYLVNKDVGLLVNRNSSTLL